VQSNLQMMQHAQIQLQALTDSINKDRDRLMALEKAMADAAAAPANPPAVSAAMPKEDRGGKGEEPRSGKRGESATAAQQLEQARADFAALEVRLKPEHPDIGRAKRMIAELEAKAEAEALEQPLSSVAAPVITPIAVTSGSRPAQNRTNSMQIEINELRQRIETKKQEEARLPTVIAAYQKKVEAAPALESELTELNRDYATLEDSYTDLLKKSEQSKIASNLERRQIGEQFKILDGARLPEKPFSPNRLRINIIGILAGLALGVALIALLEYRDTTFKTDDDIVISLALPVLAVIPAMITTGERRRAQRRRLVMALSGSFVLVVAIAAVVAWRLRLLEAWVR
jgi:uncharacterized protein involved in exopolysaccharide biosynthesis